ncbi:hydroxylysine kinase-like [Apostichopus japonicus]|uniref:hydroxylysine kinase-like n=1 Tax=Stichopus japonicus TaxID=307972 RepID=UPI003AB27715
MEGMEFNAFDCGQPFLCPEQVIAYVKEHYQLSVVEIKHFDSYDGQNFYIETVNVEGKRLPYVFKVFNSALNNQTPALSATNNVMEILKQKGFPCPEVIPTVKGDLFQLQEFTKLTPSVSPGVLSGIPTANICKRKSVSEIGSLKDTFAVHLLTYIPGVTIHDLDVLPDHIFEEMGEHLGRMHLIFQGIKLDYGCLKEKGDNNPWSLMRLSYVTNWLNFVNDPRRVHTIQSVIDSFDRHVLTNRNRLTEAIIHGDYNDVNVLASVPLPNSKDEIRVSGIIDFEHICYSYRVFDVGIAIMYILQCKVPDTDKAAMLFLRGYTKHCQLTQIERDCLYYCVAARFAQSLVYGLYHYAKHQDEYVVFSQVRGWDALEQMWSRGKDASYKCWNVQ